MVWYHFGNQQLPPLPLSIIYTTRCITHTLSCMCVKAGFIKIAVGYLKRVSSIPLDLLVANDSLVGVGKRLVLANMVQLGSEGLVRPPASRLAGRDFVHESYGTVSIRSCQ